MRTAANNMYTKNPDETIQSLAAQIALSWKYQTKLSSVVFRCLSLCSLISVSSSSILFQHLIEELRTSSKQRLREKVWRATRASAVPHVVEAPESSIPDQPVSLPSVFCLSTSQYPSRYTSSSCTSGGFVTKARRDQARVKCR